MALFQEREQQADVEGCRLLARLFKNIGAYMSTFSVCALVATRGGHTHQVLTPSLPPCYDPVLLNDVHLSEALIQKSMFLQLAAVMECELLRISVLALSRAVWCAHVTCPSLNPVPPTHLWTHLEHA